MPPISNAGDIFFIRNRSNFNPSFKLTTVNCFYYFLISSLGILTSVSTLLIHIYSPSRFLLHLKAHNLLIWYTNLLILPVFWFDFKHNGIWRCLFRLSIEKNILRSWSDIYRATKMRFVGCSSIRLARFWISKQMTSCTSSKAAALMLGSSAFWFGKQNCLAYWPYRFAQKYH